MTIEVTTKVFPTGTVDATPATDDKVLFSDTSDSNKIKDCTVDELIQASNTIAGTRSDYTPTVGASSGAATGVNVLIAKSKKKGKTVELMGNMYFNKGTLSGAVYITLPYTESCHLGGITGHIGDEGATLSLNQGRTQMQNEGKLYFEKGMGTSLVQASDLGSGNVRVRRHGVYPTAS